MLTPHTVCPDCGKPTPAGNWMRCDECAEKQRDTLRKRLADSASVGGTSCPERQEMTDGERSLPWWWSREEPARSRHIALRDDAHHKRGTKGE